MDMAVLLLHNTPEPAGGSFAWNESEAGVLNEVAHLESALHQLGRPVRVAGVRRLRDVAKAVTAGSETVVFNLVERLEGGSAEACAVPAVCQALGRACIGGSAECLWLTLDKQLTKARLTAHGVAVPAGVVALPGQALPTDWPPPPLFVKPLCSDGSEGIGPLAVVREPATQLADAVAHVHATCWQPALIERFIEGREFNIAVWEQADVPQPLPVAEIDFSLFPAGRPHVVDYAVKWHPGTIPGHVSPRRVPAVIDPALAAHLQTVACAAWRACGCRDYARIDTRLAADGTVHVLDVNVNCDLSPQSGFAAALQAAGIPFERFVESLLDNAARRFVRAAMMTVL